MKNYTVFHLHDDLSNPTTTIDSTSKYKDYIKKAKNYGMKSIAFSNHGNVFNWIARKKEVEKEGMKYIHATEAYVTKSLDKKVRDNYHVVLVALNHDGVREINYLMSDKVAFNKTDGHFYYNPRITYHELKNTSNNIAISSACLGGILNSNDEELELDFIDFMTKNKHRCFLEIQHHLVKDQITYNEKLYKIAQSTGIRLITGTDTHSLDENYARGRVALQRANGIRFDNEDGWDLTFKSYNELIKVYEKQNSLSSDVYLQAIENTNVLSDMVEEFTLDTTNKYPKFYENSEELLMQRIIDRIPKLKINSKKNKNVYLNRIKEEFEVYKQLNAIDFMLFQDDMLEYARQNGIKHGYGRGSVNGSLIAYILGVTYMDSIKHNLSFFRFLNPHRVSLCDIDIDYEPSRRQEMIDWVFNHPKVHPYGIITFNTIAKLGSIDELGRAFKIPLGEVKLIKASLNTDDEVKYRSKYSELFELIPYIEGTIKSVGFHPSGYLISPYEIQSDVGTFIGDGYVVAQCNMKELDSLNYVKLDILGLSNIEIINKTCELAGIDRINPDDVDDEDDEVWENITKSGIGIFQFEKESSHDKLAKLLSKEVLNKIQAKIPNVRRIDLLAAMNGVIRPSGDPIREQFINGDVFDNHNKEVDSFLADTLSYCIYQEQIMLYLNKFCGYSEAESDLVRRRIGKKTGTEDLLPEIKERFVSYMLSKGDEYTTEELEYTIDLFIEVVKASQDYSFSKNHSMPYSYTGYIAAYLRTHYPLEFITAELTCNEGDMVKTAKIMEYMNLYTDITIKDLQFGYSKDDYAPNRKDNSIYKGFRSVKGMNKSETQGLEVLYDKKYNTFTDVLVDIVEQTKTNAGQVETLIKLGFFNNFGGGKKLLTIWDNFYNAKGSVYKASHTDKTKLKRLEILYKIESETEDKSFSPIENIQFELENLGYIKTTISNMMPDIAMVTNIEVNKWGTTFVSLYRINNGEVETIKVNKGFLTKNPLHELDVIKTINIEESNKRRPIDDVWVTLDETEMILTQYSKVII